MALSRQDFESASTPVDRWMMRFPVSDLDERGAYIHPRSLILQGGLRHQLDSITRICAERAVN